MFLFSSCGKPNKEKNSEKQTKEELEVQLKTEQPTAEKLLSNANTFFSNKKFEESKKEIRILLNKYPASNEVYEAKTLLDKADVELDKIKKEEEKTIEEQKKKNKILIEQAIKKMRIKVDKLEDITWYHDKTSPQYTNYNGFFIYIGDRGYNYPTLRLRIQYKDSKWLFIQKYIIYVDGLKYKTIETEYGDVQRDNGSGGVWEWIDIPFNNDSQATVNDFDIIRAIIDGKDVKLKLIGKQYSKVKTITQTQKNALKNVLDVYKALKGEKY